MSKLVCGDYYTAGYDWRWFHAYPAHLCPYKGGTWQQRYWLLGWIDADRRQVEERGMLSMIDLPLSECHTQFTCMDCGHTTSNGTEGAPCNAALHPPCRGRLRSDVNRGSGGQ